MARTTKRGVCELCGVHANIGTNHGSKVCPSCTHIQSALNKRVEVVAKAARAMHKTEDLLGHLIPAGGLAVHVTAELLREISDIVGYDGENPAELVEAVRRRALTCASCEAEDVLAEIREIVGYTPERGDKGLADAVRASAAAVPAERSDLDQQWIDLMRACGLEDDGGRKDWSWAVAAAIHEIAGLTNRKNFWIEAATELKAKAVELNELIGIGEAKLILAEQSRDEWEQRAVQAESNVETLEVELRNREDAPTAPCASTTYLLDIALRALRGEGPDADQLATIIDAARRAA